MSAIDAWKFPLKIGLCQIGETGAGRNQDSERIFRGYSSSVYMGNMTSWSVFLCIANQQGGSSGRKKEEGLGGGPTRPPGSLILLDKHSAGTSTTMRLSQ